LITTDALRQFKELTQYSLIYILFQLPVMTNLAINSFPKH